MAVSTIDALYHSGSEKLTTSATGIDVTGTVTSDGLTVTQSGSTFTPSSQTVALFQRNSASGSGAKVCILAGNQSSSDLNFGDVDNEDQGAIKYEHNNDAMTFTTNGSERMRIDATGAVTKPLQPAFFATPNTNQNNIANNNSSVHVLLQTEILDNNADFALSTFTAPVTGKYMLSYSLCLLNMDSAADYYIPQIKTSNRDINSLYDPGQLNGDPAYQTFTMSVLTDMDANDTATVRIIQNGGTAQTDVEASSLRTYFSGFLVC